MVDLADEIIIVDSGSTDKTLEIARKYQAKIFSHPFVSFSNTRSFAESKAVGDWVLSLEADVVVSQELAREIRQKIKDKTYFAYFIPRLNIIWGKPIRHTDWGPADDCHIWLYQKGSGSWSGSVHEEYLTAKKTARLTNHLLHYNYETVSEFIQKTDSYSELAVKQGRSYPFCWSLRDFIKRYFYKRGFLDGYHGLFLSYLQATYFLTLFIKNKTQKRP